MKPLSLSDVSAHMALRRHTVLLGRVPGFDWRRRPSRPCATVQTRFDGTRAVHEWNSGGVASVVASVVAMLLGQRNGPRQLRDFDDNDEFVDLLKYHY